MEHITPFALYKLPYLAIEETVTNMDPFDLITLSATSQRSRQVIRILRKPYKTALLIDTYPLLTIQSSTRFLPNVCFFRHFVEDLEIIKEVLNIKIDHLIFDMDVLQCQNKEFIDWLAQYSPVIPVVELWGESVPNEDLEHFLEKIQVTERLSLNVELKEEKTVKIPRKLISLIV